MSTLYRKSDGLRIKVHLRHRHHWLVTANVGPGGEAFGWIKAPPHGSYVGPLCALAYRRAWKARYREGRARGGIFAWRCIALSTIPPWANR